MFGLWDGGRGVGVVIELSVVMFEEAREQDHFHEFMKSSFIESGVLWSNPCR